MDQAALEREIRRLRRINAVSLCGLGLVAVVAFTRGPRHARFDVIDVGRVNIVEPTGVIRLAMSNRAQFPDPVIDGKAYPLRSGARPAGLIFFNDLGRADLERQTGRQRLRGWGLPDDGPVAPGPGRPALV